VFVDGRRAGSSEDGQLLVPAGRHQIVLVNKTYNFREVVRARVSSAEVTSHLITLPTGAVHVSAPEGMEIFVDGQRMGQGPIGDLQVPIGTREVIGHHRQFGEQRVAVEVKVGTTVDVQFDGATSR